VKTTNNSSDRYLRYYSSISTLHRHNVSIAFSPIDFKRVWCK